jgi:hypothetical protein
LHPLYVVQWLPLSRVHHLHKQFVSRHSVTTLYHAESYSTCFL